MAARLLEELSKFSNFLNTGFKYNLQVFPDTITAGALLFSLLFQSPPLAALGGSFILLNFLHPVFAGFLSTVVSNTLGPTADPSLCSGSFPGISYDRLFSMSSEKMFGSLNSAAWPSYYTMFMGFLGAWVSALPLLYNAEIAASPKRKAAVTVGIVVLSIVLLIGVVFRYASGCDTLFGILVGLASGAVLGGGIVAFLAWISDRRITNILGFPLLRDSVVDGQPIYVCEKS
jgi:hypothetical protein